MAYTIQQSFVKLKENLEPTVIQKETISMRQSNIRDALAEEIDIDGSFLTGSYSRHTLIAPLKEADVDIFFVLPSKYYYNYNNQNGGQAGLLDWIKRVLKRTYPSTPDISRSGQAVTIRFTDFAVDVVVGFDRQGGGYLIPNSINQNWIETDPKKHVDIFSVANTQHNGDLVPLIKMVKAWNKSIGGYFHSFHLEVLALQILENITISDYPSGMRYFFDKAREKITKQNLDPAGYGGDIGAYINMPAKITEAVSKFQLAYDRAIKAEDFNRRDRVRDAVDMWIKIFDNYFPSYG